MQAQAFDLNEDIDELGINLALAECMLGNKGQKQALEVSESETTPGVPTSFVSTEGFIQAAAAGIRWAPACQLKHYSFSSVTLRGARSRATNCRT